MTDPHAVHDVHAADPHPESGQDEAHSAVHGDEEAPLGPIDWRAWFVSIIGLAAGGVVALVLAQTIAHG